MILIVKFTSVTRWLLVVIGCVVLATAQPMSAASSENPEAGKLSGETILYPKNPAGSAQPVATGSRDTTRSLVVVAVLLLAGVGAWLVLQRRKSGVAATRGRRLQIEETRPLGNRQYLVVADYKGEKFLLGVMPGQIQMLAPLNSDCDEEDGGAAL